MTDEQIKQMTERFLAWKLPENFNPDNGISAQRPNYGPNVKWEPTGTNLLDYTQAEAMVRHIVGADAPDLSARITASEQPNSLVWYRPSDGAFIPFGHGRTRADWDKVADANEARTANLIDD